MEKLTYIQQKLFELQDLKYRDFHGKLIPNIDKEYIIGVRAPLLKKLAKTIIKENKLLCDEFIKSPVHKYYEENNLHYLFIREIKDFYKCIDEVEKFLPYINNWATCDMPLPKVFEKNKDKLLPYIEKWISSKEEYIVRYGIGVLMNLFLDENFKEEYHKMVLSVKSDKYYVKMMVAWYFATALAKQYESSVKYLEKGSMDKWIHNKTIQKAVESYRISDEKKQFLKKLRKK